MQCTAKSKRSGVQCRKAATPGSTKCHMHGGKSLGGMASPTFKTGRYSKHLPERLAGKYKEAMRDPNLLDLRSEVALLDIRLGELVEALGGNVPDHESWSAIVDLLESRRKLVDSEHKRMVAMHQMISADRAMILLAAVVDVIRRNVEDRQVLAVISSEIRQLATVEHNA